MALAGAGLACNIAVGGPTPPASPIPVSTEAVGQLEEVWKSAVENSANGEVSVTLTEEQLTSFAALKIAEQPDAPVQDVQVFLRDGKIQLYGTAQAGSLSTTALVVLKPTVTSEGLLDLEVEEADFGPLPVPDALLETVSTALDEALTGQVGSQATGFKITSALIADGQMTLTGAINP
jgi:hypothetical protein